MSHRYYFAWLGYLVQPYNRGQDLYLEMDLHLEDNNVRFVLQNFSRAALLPYVQ